MLSLPPVIAVNDKHVDLVETSGMTKVETPFSDLPLLEAVQFLGNRMFLI